MNEMTTNVKSKVNTESEEFGNAIKISEPGAKIKMNETAAAAKNENNLALEESCNAMDYADRDAKIAEIAYLKAESRGFEPGHELEDWLAAEQEVTP
jgi:hypothetical protein